MQARPNYHDGGVARAAAILGSGYTAGGGEAAYVLTPTQSTFLMGQRVARLATADEAGAPHIVPVCFVLDGASVYIGLDAKP